MKGKMQAEFIIDWMFLSKSKIMVTWLFVKDHFDTQLQDSKSSIVVAMTTSCLSNPLFWECTSSKLLDPIVCGSCLPCSNKDL